MSHWIRYLVLPLPAAAMLIVSVVHAAGPTKPSSKQAPTTSAANAPVEEIQSAARRAEQDDDLSAEEKKQLADVYREALDERQQAEEWRTKRAQHEAARQNAPREMEKLKAAASPSAGESNPIVDSRLPLETLKQRLAEFEDRASAAAEEQEKLEAEQQRRAERWEEVRDLDDRAAHREA